MHLFFASADTDDGRRTDGRDGRAEDVRTEDRRTEDGRTEDGRRDGTDARTQFSDDDDGDDGSDTMGRTDFGLFNKVPKSNPKGYQKQPTSRQKETKMRQRGL